MGLSWLLHSFRSLTYLLQSNTYPVQFTRIALFLRLIRSHSTDYPPPPSPGTCIRRCHPYARKSASKAVLSSDAAHLSSDSPQHLTAPNAWRKQCLPLVGENPTCSVPVMQECEGLWRIRLRPPMTRVHPPDLPRFLLRT